MPVLPPHPERQGIRGGARRPLLAEPRQPVL